jgi:hypothetical protein
MWRVMFAVGENNTLLHFIALGGRRDANRVIAEASNASLGWLHASKFTDSKTHAATPDNLLPPWRVSCYIHCLFSPCEDSELIH